MAKRGNLEGSISKRDDGRWMARMSLPGGKRKYFYGDTRKDVAEKLAAATRDRDKGLPILDERETLGKFLDQWLVEVVKPSVRASTFKSYECHVRLYIKAALGNVVLSKLAPSHVQGLLNGLVKQGLSPQTALHVRATLRRALGQALRWGLVNRNVATLIDPPKVQRYKVKPMDRAQAEALLAAVQGHRLEALFTIALAVGLRQGEALGLKWADLDLDGKSLSVRHALQRVDGKLELVEPKSERSRRTIPLPGVAVNALRQHRALQSRERLLAGDRWTETGFVFSTRTGGPLDGPSVTRVLQRLVKGAGLPVHRFHDLRHDCATLLLAQGVPMRVVMDTLGHSQISLTMDTYSHVAPAIQREAADRMDEALRGLG